MDPMNEVRFRLAIKALRESGAWHLADQMERQLCGHQDVDDTQCLDCGADLTESLVSSLSDQAKDLRKYG